MLLDTTTRSIELLLGAAVTTNQLKITASWVDMTATTQSPATTTSSSNNTTPVTIVASPAASTQRKVMEVTIFNADTVSATVTVRVNDSSSLFPIVTFSIPTGQTLQYTDTLGWGLIASTVSTGPAGPTGATGHGSTTTTAAPTLVSGNWRFTVADTTAFNAFGLPIYCGDGTNSIRGTVYNVLSSTQLDIAPDSTSGTVSAITNGSTFTFSGVSGPTGPTGATGATGAAGASGALVQIAQVVVTTPQATITFSSIPGTYTDLVLTLCGRDTSSAVTQQGARIQFNGDTNTGNYLTTAYRTINGSNPPYGFAPTITSAGVVFQGIPGVSGNANATGMGELVISNYAGTAFYKTGHSKYSYYYDSTPSMEAGNFGIIWKSTAAITGIVIGGVTTAFDTGTVATLYGRK